MVKGRKWTKKEDELLKHMVLHSICDGGTQLDAFEKVGKVLGRTAGACGFRWNAVLRQEDPESYQEAKKKRVYAQLEKNNQLQYYSIKQALSFIESLRDQETEYQKNIKNMIQVIEQRKIKYQELKEENEDLKQKSAQYDLYQKQIKERYQDLLQMINHLKQTQSKDNQRSIVTGVETEMDPAT